MRIETKSIDISFMMFNIIILMILSYNTTASTDIIFNETLNITKDSTYEQKLREYDINRELDINGIFYINVNNHASSHSNLSIYIALASVILIESTYPFHEINLTDPSNPSNTLKIDHTVIIGEVLSLRLLRTRCVEDGGLVIIFEMEPEIPQSVNVTLQIAIEEKGDGGCSPGITSFSTPAAIASFVIILIILRTNRKSTKFSK